MKAKTIGIFTDTHGNLLALNAMLAYFKNRGIKTIYHLGDIVNMGPRPKECMDIFLNNPNIVCLLGNHDNDYVNNNTVPPELSHVSAQHKRFVFELLGEEYREAVSNFPTVIVQNYFGLRVAFLHYGLAREEDLEKNPKAVFRPIDTNPTAEAFDKMYEKIPADIVFFGHKHSPIDIVGKKVYCDVGSVGCHKGNFARGIIFTVQEDKSYKIERVQTPYDRAKTFDDMDKREIPNGDFIQNFYFNAD